MHIDDLKDYEDLYSKTVLLEGYKHIGITEGVCSNSPVIVGTRIEPRFIAAYGTIEETMEDFDLSKEEVEEAIRFVYCNKIG